jgi:hypothetical protein
MLAMLTGLTAPIVFAFTYRILPAVRRGRLSAGRGVGVRNPGVRGTTSARLVPQGPSGPGRGLVSLMCHP